MSRRNWFIGGLAILILLISGIYFFFPSDEPSSGDKEKELRVSFLEVNPHWADSLLKTMSLTEKSAMLLMYVPDEDISGDSIFNTQFIPGAYLLSATNILTKTTELKIDRSLLFASYYQVPVVATQKFKLPEGNENTIFGNQELFFSVTDDSLLRESINLMVNATDFHHIDGIFLPSISQSGKETNSIYRKDTALFTSRIQILHRKLLDNHVLTSAGIIRQYGSAGEKSVTSDSTLSSLQVNYRYGIPMIELDSNLSTQPENGEVSKFLQKKLKFNGICLARLSNKEKSDENKIKSLLIGGADMLISKNPAVTAMVIESLVSSGKLKANVIDAKVKRILLAKTWCKMRKEKVSYAEKKSFTAYEKTFPRRFRKAGFTLLKNDRNLLPIRNVTNNRMAVIHIGHQPESFTQQFYHYLPRQQTVPSKVIKSFADLGTLNVADYKRYATVVVTLYGSLKDQPTLIEKLGQLSQNSKLIILNFCHPENIPQLLNFPTLIQLWGNSVIESMFGAQGIFGGVTFDATLPLQVRNKEKNVVAIKLKRSRLQYTIPEDIGISADSLSKIDYIVDEGIRNKAFPGAQVFFAIDGKVFFNRSYGTHVYNERQEVKTDDLFDMASVTKVAASTIVAMSAYEKGLFKLKDSLYRHLPDTLKKHLRGPSTLRNITFQQILTHETGLAAGQPILRYIRYRDSVQGRFDRYYCDESDKYYCVPVADKFFIEREQLDTIWYAMNRMSVDEHPDYRYSDANMNLLYKLLDSKIKNRWRFYLDSLFYKPIGMFNTCYVPIENEIEPERIVPTENDRYWRKQLLRGYVHDPTAALFGGVAGNAGLFSTAEDMGILFQMLLFGGSYGGNTYFKKETVDLFVSQQPGSHRGLGFNRQVKGSTYGCSPYASENTFGHTGFTGISVWADQSIDLIYVSCTNRVHPDPENKKIINLGTTKRIHNVVYEQLKYVIPDKIELDR